VLSATPSVDLSKQAELVFKAVKHLIDEESKNMEIKWFGTATLSFSSGDESILFAPLPASP